MIIQVTSDDIEVSPSMIELAKKKLTRIDDRFPGVPEDSKEARVVLNTLPNEHFEVKIDLIAEGKEYFSQHVDFSLETAIIEAVEEIDRQVEKEKSIIEKEWEEKREIKRSPEITYEQETAQE
ncbi:MAG: HPF/RaiA family ribosome-associated protein [Patescibacteria group bacterium]|jgi:ribosomal subunit interface protein